MNIARGVIALLLLVAATAVGCVPLFIMGVLSLPFSGAPRRALTRAMHANVQAWVAAHQAIVRGLGLAHIDLRWEGEGALSTQRWYLVVSNHQSWADILILQNVLRGHIPILKFFTKRELVWVPFIGLAMWFLGFPYVRRLSREQIAVDPSLAQLDRAATLDACRAFREVPTSVLSFLEGTRFTPAKHAAQPARFNRLLNPKLGGVSYVVATLHDRLDRVLDITITYPGGVPSFWALMQGRCRRVEVLVQMHVVPEAIEHLDDPDVVRERLQPWIEALWRDKDARLQSSNGTRG